VSRGGCALAVRRHVQSGGCPCRAVSCPCRAVPCRARAVPVPCRAVPCRAVHPTTPSCCTHPRTGALVLDERQQGLQHRCPVCGWLGQLRFGFLRDGMGGRGVSPHHKQVATKPAAAARAATHPHLQDTRAWCVDCSSGGARPCSAFASARRRGGLATRTSCAVDVPGWRSRARVLAWWQKGAVTQHSGGVAAPHERTQCSTPQAHGRQGARVRGVHSRQCGRAAQGEATPHHTVVTTATGARGSALHTAHAGTHDAARWHAGWWWWWYNSPRRG